MIRTQIQIPDDIYRRAKQLSAEREISLAELARRGLEYMLAVYAPASAARTHRQSWQPPKPKALELCGTLSDDELKRASRQELVEQL